MFVYGELLQVRLNYCIKVIEDIYVDISRTKFFYNIFFLLVLFLYFLSTDFRKFYFLNKFRYVATLSKKP